MARIYKGGLEKFCKAIVQKETLSTSRMQHKNISISLLAIFFLARFYKGSFQKKTVWFYMKI